MNNITSPYIGQWHNPRLKIRIIEDMIYEVREKIGAIKMKSLYLKIKM